MSDRPTDGALGDLLDRLISQAEAQGATPPTETKAAETAAAPVSSGSSGGLEGILGNPALLTALPQLMKALGGLQAHAPTGEVKALAEAKGTGDKVTRAIPIDRHTALLCALKPYLSSERRQAAEQLISLCRVWGTLQGMGISLPALLGSPPTEARGEEKGDRHV